MIGDPELRQSIRDAFHESLSQEEFCIKGRCGYVAWEEVILLARISTIAASGSMTLEVGLVDSGRDSTVKCSRDVDVIFSPRLLPQHEALWEAESLDPKIEWDYRVRVFREYLQASVGLARGLFPTAEAIREAAVSNEMRGVLFFPDYRKWCVSHRGGSS